MTSRTIAPTMTPGTWIMLVVLSVLWGGSFFFVEVLITTWSPLTVVTLRVGLAALVLWAVVIATGRPVPSDRHAWLAFLGMGLLNNVIPFSLIAWGQTEIASGLAAILNATTPLFTVVVAGVLLKDEQATPLKVAGVLIGFAGVAVMVGPAALAGLGGAVLAQCAVLTAALTYAFAGVFGRRFRDMGVDPVVTAAGQVTGSTVVLLPFLLMTGDVAALTQAGTAIWLSMLGLAVFSTAIAYILYFRVLAAAGATNITLVTFLIPVSAGLLGIGFLGERLELEQAAGMILIGIGLSAIDGRLWTLRRRG